MKNPIFAENVKRLRKQMGMNQEQFAAFLNIKRSRIGAWEEGRALPFADVLINVCDKCEVKNISDFIKRPLEFKGRVNTKFCSLT